jgi:exonuclease VII small subunit
LKLDEAIKLYTEGVELVAYCHKELAAAEKRITVLKKKNEKLIESVFNEEEADDD